MKLTLTAMLLLFAPLVYSAPGGINVYCEPECTPGLQRCGDGWFPHEAFPKGIPCWRCCTNLGG
ncbi:hypothetical protein K443DRAFT_110297 [Laccaria amethystina LaAM-08-1]|uniref:Uncharacterized protein n=1 Tax=Laccaria amethystina LaAM-08-1 TaxID=1095629 RepID=A0A0C9XA42_9AGAR|nr:hypothetical protein K443DRAFT_110297 [Laccaria amethystina LaAM-08-1]